MKYKPHHNSRTATLRDRARELFAGGMTRRDVAAALGVSYGYAALLIQRVEPVQLEPARSEETIRADLAKQLAGMHRRWNQQLAQDRKTAEGGACMSDDASLVPWREAKRDFEREYWAAALASAGGCRAAAARLAKVNRTWLFGRLKRLGVTQPRQLKRGRWAEFGL